MEKILLFIPCYNCQKQITRVLSSLSEEVMTYISEVIVVNNRSTDNTADAVAAFMESNPFIPCKLLTNTENYNLGGSHKVAFNYALSNGFDYVIVLHGDDQADIKDVLPILRSGTHRKADCCLGSRFTADSKLHGYSAKRILGNICFNLLFSLVTLKNITDLGSGLNIYSTDMLKSRYYLRLPDELYFNDCMILFSDFFRHRMRFFPISWREDDQVSNTKLMNFAASLFSLVGSYIRDPLAFVKKDYRSDKSRRYTASTVAYTHDEKLTIKENATL